MKRGFILSIAIIFLGFQAQAQNICKSLISQAEAECDKSMCADQGDDACIRDGDFNEGMGVCVYDEVFPALIKQYNKKNPTAKIGCDSDGEIIVAPAIATFSCSVDSSKVRFDGEIFDTTIKATLSDSKKELGIKDFKTQQSNVVFNKVLRKKEASYSFSKFYSDFNAWQDLEFSFPKDITNGDRAGKFNGYFTVYADNGNIMAPSKSLKLSCRAN